MKRGLVAVLAAALITGCATAGKNFSPEVANTITNGMTREQVIERLGTTPSTVTNQGKTLIWSYAKVGFLGGTESRAVRFNFDENGKTYGIPAGGVFGDGLKYKD